MKTYKLLIYTLVSISFFNAITIQAQLKRNVTTEDYKLWSEFGSANMSNNGVWIYYSSIYQQTDTLYLQNSKTNLKYSFPKTHAPSFSDDSRWFGYKKNDSLNVLQLSSGKKHFVSAEVVGYDFSVQSDFLITNVNLNDSKSLKIINLKTFITHSISDVVDYKLSPDKTKFAVIVQKNGIATIKVITFDKHYSENVIVENDLATFKELIWDESGKKLAFFSIKNETTSLSNPIIHWCTGFDKKVVIKTLDPTINKYFPKGNYITLSGLYVSDKYDHVFFDIKKIPQDDELSFNKGDVEVWLPEDSAIPHINPIEKLMNMVKWTLWNIDKDTVVPVEDDDHGNVILTDNEDFALLYNADELTPLRKFGGEFIAIYIKDLQKGKKELLLPKHTFMHPNQAIVSPAGKYVSYFKDNNWWIYDIALRNHKCLTIGMPLPLCRLDYDRPPPIPAFGSPGWTTNDEEIIIYDQFDIWFLKPDGSSKRRLTDGQKAATVYRLNEKRNKPSPKDSFFGFQVPSYDFNKSILLKTQNNITLGEGFAIYNSGKVKELFKKESQVMYISASKDEKEYLFTESNFELPPRILKVNQQGKETVINQSNTQQKDFFWGKSNLINYTIEGKNLKGALFYPANYDSSKTYPLIVSIYERKSMEVINYIVPSNYSMYGFNTSNYTNDGYFVLYPDLAFGINSPGNDALISVKTAVKESLKIASIDENNLALMGHSFGGYETAYIMGHTTIFKTAVIGAPMIDLSSEYLTLDGHNTSTMWRFEYGQMRINEPFYSTTFDDNSPLKSAKDINSPILLWTGTADKQLDWKHAMKLHNALWRLDKKSTLLVYPNEEHILVQDKNQLDLTTKVKDWLDYYLKDRPSKKWMGNVSNL